MPIPYITRIDSRDLDENKAIGIPLPFNGNGVFNSTFSTQNQIKSNLINLLLTYKGERIINPDFGADLPRLLFEPITEELYIKIQDQIIESVLKYVPEVNITNIQITPSADTNSIYIGIEYSIKISGNKDNIIIEIQ